MFESEQDNDEYISSVYWYRAAVTWQNERTNM